MIATPAVLLPAAAAVIAALPAAPGQVDPSTPRPAPPAAPPGSERGEEFGKTSPIALVVILLLLVATVLLIRSMNSRLRNVPQSFGTADPTSGPDPDAGADPGPGVEPDAGGAAGDPGVGTPTRRAPD